MQVVWTAPVRRGWERRRRRRSNCCLRFLPMIFDRCRGVVQIDLLFVFVLPKWNFVEFCSCQQSINAIRPLQILSQREFCNCLVNLLCVVLVGFTTASCIPISITSVTVLFVADDRWFFSLFGVCIESSATNYMSDSDDDDEIESEHDKCCNENEEKLYWAISLSFDAFDSGVQCLLSDSFPSCRKTNSGDADCREQSLSLLITPFSIKSSSEKYVPTQNSKLKFQKRQVAKLAQTASHLCW